MSTTVTETESWGSRLGNSIKGVLFGLVLFVLGFPVLFWNEGNTVKTRKALEEGQGVCVSVESNEAVDPALEGRLVHMSGLADTREVLADPQFGISETAIKLVREVEMYQWQEESHTTEKKNVGGSVTKTTTYTYDKTWSSSVIDSSSFREAGHDNPAAMEFQSCASAAKLVTFGAFRLSDGQIGRIGGEQPCVFEQDYVCPVPRAKVIGSMIYVPNAATRLNEKNLRDPVAEPRIGDMRISFSVVKPHDISLVARQHGDSFVPYVAKNGRKVQLLSDGTKDADEMFADAQNANSFMCWILRLAGFLMMFIGVKTVLKPLSVLGDVLPFLGDLLEMGAGLAAFAVAAPCALVTIAVAWFFYRPEAAVLLVLAACAIVYLSWRRKQAKNASAAQPAP